MNGFSLFVPTEINPCIVDIDHLKGFVGRGNDHHASVSHGFINREWNRIKRERYHQMVHRDFTKGRFRMWNQLVIEWAIRKDAGVTLY